MEGAEDYVTRREFEASNKYYDRMIASVEKNAGEAQARVEREVRHLAEVVEKAVAQMKTPPASAPVDHASLALQRTLDLVERRVGKSGGGWQGVALGALLPVIAWLAWKVLT